MDFNSETRMKDIALSNAAARQTREDRASFIAVVVISYFENNILFPRTVEMGAAAAEGSSG